MSTPSTTIVLVTPNFENNSLGRTYCLWLLAKHLGLAVSVHGVKGTTMWKPLADSAFAADCVLPSFDGDDAQLMLAAATSDLLLGVKPLPTSFGTALRISESTGVPILLDIDDPDIEVRTIWLPWYEQIARRVLKSRYRRLLQLGRLARTVPRMVSNPALQQMYGGSIIPHVREIPVTGALPSLGTHPVVRFVGSQRGHKGVNELRAAVARLAGDGFRLEVTGTSPQNPAEWETWLGETTIEVGAELVATADIIAIPSLAGSWSPAQLPAKLVDAMSQGRAIVASRTAPIAWALGDAGILVEPGDVDQLTEALRRLADPHLRTELGARARARAVELLSVESVAPRFERVISDALNVPTRYRSSKMTSMGESL